MRFHEGNLSATPPPDYLDASRHSGTPLGKLGICFFPGSTRFTGLSIADAPFSSVQTLFKIELKVTQLASNAKGYFFSKTTSDGSPYFALSYDPAFLGGGAAVVFEYGTSTGVRTEAWNADALNQPERNLEVSPHVLVLDVRGTSVALTVGTETIVRQLGQLVPDCEPSGNCLFNVGQATKGGNGRWEGGGVCLKSATVQLPESVDLLDPLRTGQRPDFDLPTCSQTTAGAINSEYCFDGTRGVLVERNPPELIKTAFELTLNARINSGGSGYLISRTSLNDERAFALYMSPAGFFQLYYHVPGNARSNDRVSFNARRFPRDGAMHTIVMTVAGVHATIVVDNLLFGTSKLTNEITDCSDTSDCAMFIGQRAPTKGAGASARGAIGYALTDGCIAEARLRNAQPVGVTTRERVNLLDANVHQQLGVTTDPTTGGFCVPTSGTTGSEGLLVANAPAIVSDGFMLSFSADLTTVKPQQSGYLFSRADADGVQYFGLFIRSASTDAKREVKMYYRTIGSRAIFSTTLTADAPASGVSTMRLAVDTVTSSGSKVSRASLQIAGTDIKVSKLLKGVVDDCGPSTGDCVTYLGQRQPTPGPETFVGDRQANGFALDGVCINKAVLSP